MSVVAIALLAAGSSPFQQPPVEAARFYAAYPQSRFSPIFRESLETFLNVESAYKAKKYTAARRLAKTFWEKHPPGTEVWEEAYRDAAQTSRTVGVNIGHPPGYYALRMLTECLDWKLSGKPAPKTSVAPTLSIVLVGETEGVEPRSRPELEAGKGQAVRRSLHPRLLADNYQLIRESTWLFEEYVQAATEGELKLKVKIVSLPKLRVPFEVIEKGLRHAGLGPEAWGRLWKAVPSSQRRATDWWWVIYPSAVPDAHPDFKTTEFITGGMGVGPDGGSPCFIIDDKWLIRRPPHLGQGPYTDVERRAYLPQWFQHEFFHHLFRIYPEYRLEVDGHDWFDPQKWPKDFEGRLEPDYYAEALRRRFKGSKPSLAHRLLYAAPSEQVLRRVSLRDLVGTYRHEPEQNSWHRGSISFETGQDGRLRWTNDAGKSWLLTPKVTEGVLATGPDSPYYEQSPFATIVLERDASGKYLPKVAGFSFNATFYRKIGD